ncbi:MAG: hypothetical protein R3E60_05485 [Alphaproteobacteria bacterium]
MAKTWTEKFHDAKSHQVKPAPIDIAGMKKGEIMLITSPKILDAFIRKIPSGVSMDVKTLRKKLAKKYQAEVACPITTGFHLRTVAEAALEAYKDGAKLTEITPFWRVLDAEAPTSARLSCGLDFIIKQRRREGLS